MRKLLILLSLTPIAIVTGCPKDSPSPSPTPDQVITFGKTNAVFTIDGDIDNFDWVGNLQITATTGKPITIEVDHDEIDPGFEWKTNRVISVKAISGSTSKTEAISLTFVDNNYLENDIYRELEKGTFKIKIPTGVSTSSQATAHIIDYDIQTGEVIFATNHHVIMNKTSDIALIRNWDIGKTYTNQNELLNNICAEVIAYDPNARTSGIDLAFLRAIGTTSSEQDCTTYEAKRDFRDVEQKIRMFNVPGQSYANYSNSSVSKYKDNTMNYYAIGFPNVTYKKDTFKFYNMAEQRQMKNEGVDTYKFDAMYFETYFGAGSSGMPIIDQNMVLVGINSQGFEANTPQLQAGVMTTDIRRFTTNVYCPIVGIGYGRFC